MNLIEISKVLAKAAAFDQRTVGEADILAWHEAVGHLDFNDALAAVTRHYMISRERLWPADVISNAQAIRNDRARARPSEARALPSRFEEDEIRDERLRQGLAACIEVITAKTEGGEPDAHERALRRARAERGKRPLAKFAKRSGKVLPDKTPAPEWTREGVREALAVDALHVQRRNCGRPNCPNEVCRDARS